MKTVKKLLAAATAASLLLTGIPAAPVYAEDQPEIYGSLLADRLTVLSAGTFNNANFAGPSVIGEPFDAAFSVNEPETGEYMHRNDFQNSVALFDGTAIYGNTYMSQPSMYYLNRYDGISVFGDLEIYNSRLTDTNALLPSDPYEEPEYPVTAEDCPYLYISGKFRNTTNKISADGVNLFAASADFDESSSLQWSKNIFLYDPVGESVFYQDLCAVGSLYCNNEHLRFERRDMRVQIDGDLVMTNPGSILYTNCELYISGALICMGSVAGLERIHAEGGIFCREQGEQISAESSQAVIRPKDPDTPLSGITDVRAYLFETQPQGEALFPAYARRENLLDYVIRWDCASETEVEAAAKLDDLCSSGLESPDREWQIIPLENNVHDDTEEGITCYYVPAAKTGGRIRTGIDSSGKLDRQREYADMISRSMDLTLSDVMPYDTARMLEEKRPVSFVSRNGSGVQETFMLDDAYTIEQSCSLELNPSWAGDGTDIFIDPYRNGYSADRPMMIELTGEMPNHMRIIVNNHYLYDSGYDQITQSEEREIVSGESDVIIRFGSAFNTHYSSLQLLTTGIYAQYTEGMLHAAKHPVYPDEEEKWNMLRPEEKYAYELVPNVTLIGVPGAAYPFTNGLFLNANILMPDSSISVGTGSCSVSGTYTGTEDGNYTAAFCEKANGWLNSNVCHLGTCLVGRLESPNNCGLILSYNRFRSCVPAAGRYGDLFWTLSDDGTLTVSGRGSMPELSRRSDAPWAAYAETVKRVVILSGVDEIGALSFSGCTNLLDVQIPAGLSAIGSGAFENCTHLRRITMPDRVTDIEEAVFAGCTALERVIIRNPECRIFDSLSVFPSEAEIWGYTDSTAHTYAVKYGNPFVPLDPSEPDMTTTTTTTTTTSVTTPETTAGETTATTNWTTNVTTAVTTRATTTSNATTESTATSEVVITSYASTTTTTPRPTTTSTTTTSITTTTSTTPQPTTTSITTTATAAVSRFVLGVDNWGFYNSSRHFGTTYTMMEEDRAALLSRLSVTERTKILEELKRDWEGSCYGMSVTAILQTMGAFSPSDLDAGKEMLSSVPGSLDVLSVINYYQMLQYTDAVHQRISCYAHRMQESDKLAELLSGLEAGKPVLLCYYYSDGTQSYAHAVVAYEAEKVRISRSIQGVTYTANRRIRIYNCKAKQQNVDSDQYDMYVNTDTGVWYILNTEHADEISNTAITSANSGHAGSGYAGSGYIGFVCSDLSFLNYKGLLNGTTSLNPDSDAFYADLSEYLPQNAQYQAAIERVRDSGGIHDDDDDILPAAMYLGGDSMEQVRSFTMRSAKNGYRITYEQPQKAELQMRYENCLLNVSADQMKTAVLRPDGGISVSGESGSFACRLVCNEGTHPTDWHTVTVSGKSAGNVQMTPVEDGWILKTDAPDQITVQAENDSSSAFLVFPADSGELKILEEDAQTIVVCADADNDGIYEQEIARSTKAVSGDADGDGILRVTDAVLLCRFVSESDDLTAEQLAAMNRTVRVQNQTHYSAADLDCDGMLTLRDIRLLTNLILSAQTKS